MSADLPSDTQKNEEPSRRDFIYLATGAFAAAGAIAVAYPMVAHLAPAADNMTQKGIEVDLTQIAEGEQLKLLWQGKPVFIRHRTPEEIAAAKSVDLSELWDKETDQDRLKPMPNGEYNPKYLIMYGVCTHMNAVPIGEYGDYDGWYCPAHGAHYDTSGRLRKGPGMKNMKIVPHHYTSETSVNIGYNKLEF